MPLSLHFYVNFLGCSFPVLFQTVLNSLGLIWLCQLLGSLEKKSTRLNRCRWEIRDLWQEKLSILIREYTPLGHFKMYNFFFASLQIWYLAIVLTHCLLWVSDHLRVCFHLGLFSFCFFFLVLVFILVLVIRAAGRRRSFNVLAQAIEKFMETLLYTCLTVWKINYDTVMLQYLFVYNKYWKLGSTLQTQLLKIESMVWDS